MAEDHGPLTSEELAARPNVPPTSPVPEEIRALAKQVDVHISTIREEAETVPTVRQTSTDKRVWAIQATKDVTFGLLPRAVQLVEPNEIANLAAEDPKPNRPQWAELAFRPTPAHLSLRRMLRSVSGQPITPHWVFPPENRQVYYPSGYPWQCIGKVFIWTNVNSAAP